MIVFDDTQPIEKKLVCYPNQIKWKNGIPVSEKVDGKAVDLSDIWEEPLKAECRAFLDSIANNTAPLTSGEEGLRVLKILESCQQSLEQKEHGVNAVIPAKAGIHEINGDILGNRGAIDKVSPFIDVFIHPTAIVDDNVTIGEKTKIWHFSHILGGSKIGQNCNIGQNVVIGPDATIGNKCKIQNNVSVYKGVTLEDGVFCGPSMVFTNIFNPGRNRQDGPRPLHPRQKRSNTRRQLHHSLRPYHRQLRLHRCRRRRDERRPRSRPDGRQPRETNWIHVHLRRKIK